MGPVSLVHDGVTLDIGGPKPRAVVALLALEAGHHVATSRLIDLVWDNPPVTARRTMQSYVARIRRACGPGAPIHTDSSGIVLDVEESEVDLLEFQRVTIQALHCSGAIEELTLALEAQLAQWDRIAPDVRRTAGLDAAFAPYEALHLSATEQLARSRIEIGQAETAIPELESLVRLHPTRESLWELLGRAHVRVGRTDLAMEVLQHAREALREELGIDLSTLLADFERELLEPSRTEMAGSPKGSAEPVLAAVMFTDLIGSTALSQRVGKGRYDELRLVHQRSLRDAFGAEHGVLSKSEGDGVMRVFRSAVDALRAACGLQRRVSRQVEPQAEPMGVRIGIGAGDVLLDDVDAEGPVVLEASRLCEHAEAGQIMCNELLAILVAGRSEFTFGEVVSVAAKGLAEPIKARPLDWRAHAEILHPFPSLLINRIYFA